MRSALAIVLPVALSASAMAASPVVADVEERLGERVPSELTFRDHDGNAVRLGDLLARNEATLLVLSYYECPMLCGLVLRGVVSALAKLDEQGASGWRAVTVSFDPHDPPSSARKKRLSMIESLGRDPGAAWPFLVAEQEAIAALTDAVGFRYEKDDSTGQYAHAAVVMVLGPDGKISRYLYGIDFPSRDLRFALAEASAGRVGSTVDRLLLTCFRWDPATRRYVPWVFGFLRIGGAIVALGLVGLVIALRRRERRGGR